MRTMTNECGSRNSFGYYDRVAKEIVLKRPCVRKQDLEEVLQWMDIADDLRKLSIGLGAVDNLVIDNSTDGLYAEARSTIKQAIIPNACLDNRILSQLLTRLADKEKIANISLKCFTFTNEPEIFNLLLKTIRERKNLVYLDLTGCYFTDEQLLDLAKVISQTMIARLIWPEPRMSPMVLEHVVALFKENKSITVVQGVPMEINQIVADNRSKLFVLARNTSAITEKEREFIRAYKNSYRLAIAFEKERLFEMEKTVEAIIGK